MSTLRYSKSSPFVRKCLATAIEAGLFDTLKLHETNVHDPESDITRDNPLGKVPVLLLDNGMALYDSRVICEYLDSCHSGRRLIPASGPARWEALRFEALADGILDACVLRRMEHMYRTPEQRSDTWLERQKGKVTRGLDTLESLCGDLDPKDPGIGEIAVGCALGFLDFRFPEDDWRGGRPKLAAFSKVLAERPCMARTVPSG